MVVFMTLIIYKIGAAFDDLTRRFFAKSLTSEKNFPIFAVLLENFIFKTVFESLQRYAVRKKA